MVIVLYPCTDCGHVVPEAAAVHDLESGDELCPYCGAVLRTK